MIDWRYNLAERLDHQMMVRLVRGGYWDTEIKSAQVEGLRDYPVFTRKAAADISFIVCAKQLLAGADQLYLQSATALLHKWCEVFTV